MQKIIVPILSLILLFQTVHSYGQVYISSDMFEATKLTVTATIIDEKSNEPLSFASVYLVPKGDTVISHFALSDSLGVAKIPDVTKGSYIFHVEYLGYKPFEKEYFFKKRTESLGKIMVNQDLEMLAAATVAAAANPITVKQDTIEYNASSFNVSQNAMLGDLLKKMPGIEISGGDVKVNGKPVSKITVNGKTFFFDDKSAALNNLPAKVVDKVKVIDKDSKSAEFSGIADQEKEKVMDITLKKEYEKGWFGNARAQGGYTLVGKEKDNLVDGRGALYSGNAMVASYNKKSQLTVVANANNVKDPNAGMYIKSNEDGEFDTDFGGLPSSYQVGANLNTTAIKGMMTDAVAGYNRLEKVDRSRASRTTFISDTQNLLTNSSSESSSFNNTAKASLRISTENPKKFMIGFEPGFSYSFAHKESQSASSTSDGQRLLNSSDSKKRSDTRSITTGGLFAAGVRDIGKKNRSINIKASYTIYNSDTESKEYSLLSGNKNETRDLLYNTAAGRNTLLGEFGYVEPVAENWNLSLRLRGSYSRSITDKVAFDNLIGENNDYYSAYSDNKSIIADGSILAQYKKKKSNIQFGASLLTTLNELYSKSFGVSTTTGKDEWYYDWAPFVRGSYSMENSRIYANYSGRSKQPSRSRILPVLDVSNPASISTGNIYLTPGFDNNFYFIYDRNNKKTFSYISFNIDGAYSLRDIVTASWFDKDGIRYSVPVNSKKPAMRISAYLSYNQPFGKERKFSFNIYAYPSLNRNISYQSAGIMEGMNVDSFNYSEFMSKFWGDNQGSRFYSGESGFKESKMTNINISGGVGFRYKGDSFQANANYSPYLRFARYSLDKSANLNTRDHRFGVSLEYRTTHNWELRTGYAYRFYRGYAYGYEKPQNDWSIGINKDIKSITLSLSVYDILNNTRSLSRTVNENYMEDSYRLVMGRYFMFGIKVNFGKMNAANAQKAQDASWRML